MTNEEKIRKIKEILQSYDDRVINAEEFLYYTEFLYQAKGESND